MQLCGVLLWVVTWNRWYLKVSPVSRFFRVGKNVFVGNAGMENLHYLTNSEVSVVFISINLKWNVLPRAWSYWQSSNFFKYSVFQMALDANTPGVSVSQYSEWCVGEHGDMPTGWASILVQAQRFSLLRGRAQLSRSSPSFVRFMKQVMPSVVLKQRAVW